MVTAEVRSAIGLGQQLDVGCALVIGYGVWSDIWECCLVARLLLSQCLSAVLE